MPQYIAAGRVNLAYAISKGMDQVDGAKAILEIDLSQWRGAPYWRVVWLALIPESGIVEDSATGSKDVGYIALVERTDRDPQYGTSVMGGRGMTIFTEWPVDEAGAERIRNGFPNGR